MTEPQLLFDYPDPTVQVLDADISVMPDGRYCMMYVAQTGKSGIKKAVSQYINRDYVYEPDFVDKEPKACEAPNVWKRIGEDKWILMYDSFSLRPSNFGFVETTDFVTFTDLGHFNEEGSPMKATNFTSPPQARDRDPDYGGRSLPPRKLLGAETAIIDNEKDRPERRSFSLS